MKYPKIEITYSSVYDRILHSYHKKKYGKNQENLGKKYAAHLQKIWDKRSRRILETMSKVSGLRWENKVIKVYPVRYVLSEFAWPLTIYIYKDDKRAISILIHELSHNLIEQNKKNIRWGLIDKRYKNCSGLTISHLLTHAICMLTLKKIFKERAEAYLRYERFWEWDDWELGKHYEKSWQIVMRKSPENIIKEHTK